MRQHRFLGQGALPKKETFPNVKKKTQFIKKVIIIKYMYPIAEFQNTVNKNQQIHNRSWKLL